MSTVSDVSFLGKVLTIQELAAAVGAIMAGPISDIYSRKFSISAWVVVFSIGVIIQTAGNENVATIYGEFIRN